jgi:hypothetical protein
MAELKSELLEIYYKECPWQIKELEMGQFLVRFPPHKRVTDIKNYPSFNLRKNVLGICNLMGNYKMCGFK